MTSFDEYTDKVIEEVRQFRLRWDDTFNRGEPQVVADMVEEDAVHPPAMLRKVIGDITEEAVNLINHRISELELSSEREAFDFAVTNLVNWARLTCVRMFRMGQETVTILPWKGLTPCACHRDLDEELDSFLKENLGTVKLPPRHKYKYEGEGFKVIDTEKDKDK